MANKLSKKTASPKNFCSLKTPNNKSPEKTPKVLKKCPNCAKLVALYTVRHQFMALSGTKNGPRLAKNASKMAAS